MASACEARRQPFDPRYRQIAVDNIPLICINTPVTNKITNHVRSGLFPGQVGREPASLSLPPTGQVVVDYCPPQSGGMGTRVGMVGIVS